MEKSFCGTPNSKMIQELKNLVFIYVIKNKKITAVGKNNRRNYNP